MTESGSDHLQEAVQGLADAIVEIGAGFVAERDFLGRMVAREFMDEFEISGKMDPVGDAALEGVLGTCVTAGFALGMRHTTDEAAIQQTIDRLNADLVEELRPHIGFLIPHLIPRGIALYDDLLAETPKVQTWSAEFRANAEAER